MIIIPHETCGFTDNAFDLDILVLEFKNIGSVDIHDTVDFSKKEQNSTYYLWCSVEKKMLSRLKESWLDMLSEMVFLQISLLKKIIKLLLLSTVTN